MIPIVLAPPLPAARARRPSSISLAGALGATLIMVGVVAVVVWAAAVSPYGFARFTLADADRTISVRQGGTYLVFEEFTGASGDEPPLPLQVSVIDQRGRPVEVTYLIDPTDPGAADSYRVPFHEGRAVARFQVPEGGRYLVQVDVRPPGTYPAGLYRADPAATVAIGRPASLTWMGSVAAPLVVGVAPVVVGVGLLARACRSRAGTQRRAPPPAPGGHGGQRAVR
ncbi:hypothetical protein [Rhabdothermincola sp.]|uniref:hypothetical protein n=1 Tax=Rhabdothermincola sp. TaxID=2820405 RepID=UPI002FE34923